MNEDRRLTELQNNLQAMQKDGMDGKITQEMMKNLMAEMSSNKQLNEIN